MPTDNAPNLNLDIDALFKHLKSTDSDALTEPKEWVFQFRHDDVDHLAEIAESLADEFQVDLQESVETQDGDDVFDGPPLLSVAVVDVLKLEEVKALAARFTKLAQDKKLTYEGVSTYDPMDMDELEAFLDLEGAQWRLRSMADSGMPKDAELVYEFCLITPDKKSLRAAEAALQPLEPADLIEDESPDDGPVLLAYFMGEGDESTFTKRFKQVEAAAAKAKLTLLGVRFMLPDDEGDED